LTLYYLSVELIPDLLNGQKKKLKIESSKSKIIYGNETLDFKNEINYIGDVVNYFLIFIITIGLKKIKHNELKMFYQKYIFLFMGI